MIPGRGQKVRGQTHDKTHMYTGTDTSMQLYNHLQDCHVYVGVCLWLCGPGRGLKWARLPGVP